MPPRNTQCNPMALSWREFMNVIFHMVRNVWHWRLRPKDFLPWQTAYHLIAAVCDMAGKMKALERENRELRQANEILRKASAYFAQAELDRPFKK